MHEKPGRDRHPVSVPHPVCVLSLGRTHLQRAALIDKRIRPECNSSSRNARNRTVPRRMQIMGIPGV